jgi:hypothetical protein
MAGVIVSVHGKSDLQHMRGKNMYPSSRFASFGAQKSLRLLLLAPLALLLATAAPARAAHLDEALLRAAPNILLYLDEHGYKNVGVLPFQVKKGERQASYLGAPLSTSLPGRLENALIMSQTSGESQAIGIIRDAAGTASQAKIGSYTRSPAAFGKLFKTGYNLAWGNKKVKAEAFLTGVVSNTGDHSKTTVQILLFTPESRQGGSLKMARVGKPVSVMTDRSLLRDLGYTFALARSVVTKRGETSDDRDDAAVQQVSMQEEGRRQNRRTQSNAVTPDNIAGFAFELRYDGAKQRLRRIVQSQQGAKAPLYEVDPMMPGTEVAMVLTPLLPDDKKLGVVLKVNGRSTWQEEDDESIRCKKWIYDVDLKGKPDLFKGFYTGLEGKNLKPWNVLSAAESARAASEMGDRAGWIDIDVFANADDAGASDQEEPRISTRGMARSKKKFSTMKSLQASLRKANNVKIKKSVVTRRGAGGLLVSDSEPAEEVQISTDTFPNPVRIGGISIRYYDAKSGGDKQDEGDSD